MTAWLRVDVERQHPAPEPRAGYLGDPCPQLHLVIGKILLSDRYDLAGDTSVLRTLLPCVHQIRRGWIVLISDSGDVLTGPLLREEGVRRGIVVTSLRRVNPVKLSLRQSGTSAATLQTPCLVLALTICRALVRRGRPCRVAVGSPGTVDRAASRLVRLLRVCSLTRPPALGDRVAVPVVVVALILLVRLRVLLLVPLTRLLAFLRVLRCPRSCAIDPLLAARVLLTLALSTITLPLPVLAADVLSVSFAVVGVVRRVGLVPCPPLCGQARCTLVVARPCVTQW